MGNAIIYLAGDLIGITSQDFDWIEFWLNHMEW
jgi:hypothetical protein